jgi:3-deoxy-D-manno-octulosonic-acid transferase
VVLLESEFWPVMTMACQARGIPLVVANARLSERSHARLQQVGPLRRLLAGYAGAAAQNEEHAARLQSLGMPKVAVTGTMKADLVRPVSPEAARAEAQRIGLRSDRPLLLLASTSPDEEAVILDRERLAWWRAAGWQVAIAPRHPERGPALAALARSWGGSPCLTASPACPSPTPDHLPIINEIGRLGALYGLAALSGGIAVVGGSLGSGRGGQNMLEAAAHGCATVVGWDVRNQPDAMALLRAADGVVEVHAGAVHPRLQELAQDLPTRRALGDAGRNAWTAGLGAADRTAAHLDALLG